MRVFWAIDRALGGERPPSAVQQWFAALHPVRLALTTSACWIALVLWCVPGDVQRADLVVGLPSGIVACTLIGWMAYYERARQQRLRQLGIWDGTRENRCL